jgi:hypothetical protein
MQTGGICSELCGKTYCDPRRAPAQLGVLHQSLCDLDHFSQLPARIEHARFDRGFGSADDRLDFLDRFAVVVDEVDGSPCSGNKLANDWRKSSLRFFFCSAISGSSAGSTILAATFLSSSTSVRRQHKPKNNRAFG